MGDNYFKEDKVLNSEKTVIEVQMDSGKITSTLGCILDAINTVIKKLEDGKALEKMLIYPQQLIMAMSY